jgi:hypothetical protein
MFAINRLPQNLIDIGLRRCLMAAVFVLWFGTAPKVEGSCGDHLRHAGQSPVSGQTHAKTPNPFDREVPATPCSGLNCRSAPQAPGDVPPSEIHSFSAERWTTGLVTGSLYIHASRMIRRRNAIFLPEDHRASLERPPRAAGLNFSADGTCDLRVSEDDYRWIG